MMQEMEEFAYTDEERLRILDEEKERWDEEKRFAPTIKDADPDDDSVPKDGCQMTWLGWYWRVMREKEEAGKWTPNEFYNLFLIDILVTLQSTTRKPENAAKLRQERSRKSGSNLVFHFIIF
jgi:hypothetical protein